MKADMYNEKILIKTKSYENVKRLANWQFDYFPAN